VARVEIRTATLDVNEAEVARLSKLLDEAERARAARFRFARDHRRFVVRRGRLREWLGEQVGERPERLAFSTGPHDKPALAHGPHFSLSHSAEWMMAAFADVDIGCDIERIDDAIEWRPLADHLFAPAERAALAGFTEPGGRIAFFDCWARKEAFIKAIGLGLSHPLDAFTVSVGDNPGISENGWAIAASAPRPGYAGAVVARDDGTPLTIRSAAIPTRLAA
jgi:4'-phosphopantetheinyl transferase